MPSFGASIRVDTASPLADAMATGISRAAFRRPTGEAAKLVLMEHFAGREQQAASAKTTSGGHPKLGHVGLFSDFARATAWTVTPAGVMVSINHVAFRQRLQGGTIKPVNKQFLTIPAREGAYGRRAREVRVKLKFGLAFDDRLGRWRKALVADEVATKAKRAGAWYWLVRQVNQDPDPAVLPYDELMTERVAQALAGWVEEISNG